MKIDKQKFKDSGGRFITQSLFLEYQYDVDMAVYTLDEHDKEYKGVVYPSLKTLYLNSEDVHEYTFAREHLYSWDHWNRLLQNKWCFSHIKKWREELEVAIASRGVQKILDMAEENNFQAAKYAADRKWNAKVGRPSKQDVERNTRIQEAIDDEFAEDAERMGEVVNIK